MRSGLFLGLAGIAISVYTLTVREVTVEVGNPGSGPTAFHAPITVRNSGYLPLRRVRIVPFVREAKYPPDNVIGESMFGSPTRVEWLGIGDAASARLPNMPLDQLPLLSAEISVLVEFQRWRIPWWTVRDAFRYEAFRDSGGQFRWIPQPRDPEDWQRFEAVTDGTPGR